MKYETCNFTKAGRLVNTAIRFAVCWNKEGATQHKAFVMNREKSAKGKPLPLCAF